MAAGRHGKYLYRRRGSANWYLRLVYPPEFHDSHGRRSEQSMGTADRDEALAKAAFMIRAHKVMLIIARSIRTGSVVSGLSHEPGDHAIPGGRMIATPTTLIYLDAAGNVVRQEPNTASERLLLQAQPEEIRALGITGPTAVKSAPKPEPKPVDSDIELLTEYLLFKGHDPAGPYAAEAHAAWSEFKALVRGKLLKDCDRRDGRAYVDSLRAKGLKTATVVKRVNFLAAPINHANQTGDMKGNPFFRVVDHKDDAVERVEFSDADMALMREHMLPKLGEDERLMWRILASTGMRHSEAFDIAEEHERGGIRFVRVGKKTESSRREVPIPDCLAPYLPARITGPLFKDPSLKNISKNLLRAVRRAGITDPQKVVYSLRHRAHTRLRHVECPPDFERAIVGHETGESHVKYGSFPLPQLKRWIDEIGF
ncbi:tyrosine-type recombinase/integrase [Methylobacterium phyllosphaerae]